MNDPHPRAGRPSWVVVPARDEREHIEDCLLALRAAAAMAPGPVHVVVVDDGSTDGTAAIAASCFEHWPGRHAVLPGRSAGVGWARRLGLEHALAAAAQDADGAPAPALETPAAALIATTDADSTVAPDWLAALHRRLDEGYGVIAGDVLLHPTVEAPLVAARAVRLAARLAALPATEAATAPHPHFAGSNLGFASEVLRRLGPLPTPASLEDQAILERCRALGIPVLRDAGVQITTSGRTVGRAEGGLAAALAGDLAALRP